MASKPPRKRIIMEWSSFFNKSALFISVLISSLGQTKLTVILVSYITHTWPDVGLLKATLIVNFEEGITGVLILVLNHMATAFSAQFKMVLLSTVAYITGLVLLWRGLSLYVAVLLIAVGKAGVKPLLKEFLAAQFINTDKSLNEDEKRVKANCNCLWGFWWNLGTDKSLKEVVKRVKANPKCWWGFWWTLGTTLGFILGMVGVSASSNKATTFIFTTSLMGIALVMFLAGATFYQYKEPTDESLSLTTIYQVLKAAISKVHLSYPDDLDAYYKNDNQDIQLVSESRFLR